MNKLEIEKHLEEMTERLSVQRYLQDDLVELIDLDEDETFLSDCHNLLVNLDLQSVHFSFNPLIFNPETMDSMTDLSNELEAIKTIKEQLNLDLVSFNRISDDEYLPEDISLTLYQIYSNKDIADTKEFQEFADKIDLNDFVYVHDEADQFMRMGDALPLPRMFDIFKGIELWHEAK